MKIKMKTKNEKKENKTKKKQYNIDNADKTICKCADDGFSCIETRKKCLVTWYSIYGT